MGPKHWDSLQPKAVTSQDPLFTDAFREWIPSPFDHLPVRATPNARVLARFTKPMSGSYDGVPTISDDPALVVRSIGRGQSIYVPADLGTA